LRRVLRLLDLLPPRGAVRRACAGIVPTLAHHRATPGDFSGNDLPPRLAECYRVLCAEGGRRPPAVRPALAPAGATAPLMAARAGRKMR
jgi:hypothetical protein